MKKILNGMIKTMDLVKPPRITALQDLHNAEDRGPFSILIGTIWSEEMPDALFRGLIILVILDVLGTIALPVLSRIKFKS